MTNVKQILNGIFIVLILNITSSSAFSQTAINSGEISKIMKILYHEWYVKSFSSLPISALSNEESKKYLEQSVSFRSNLAIIFNDTCTAPAYSVKKFNTNVYLKNFRVTGEMIGIKADSICVIDISCKMSPKYFSNNSPEFNYILIYDGARLSILYNGIIFQMEKKHIEKAGNFVSPPLSEELYAKKNLKAHSLRRQVPVRNWLLLNKLRALR